MDLIFYDAERIHGISTELAAENGISLAVVLEKFNEALGKAKFIVGQNLGFDLKLWVLNFIVWDWRANE
jgi:DNA polymerase-3 subunit alpha